jgi:hypothetical protein
MKRLTVCIPTDLNLDMEPRCTAARRPPAERPVPELQVSVEDAQVLHAPHAGAVGQQVAAMQICLIRGGPDRRQWDEADRILIGMVTLLLIIACAQAFSFAAIE